jgi:polyisoprenoid-binding protein YceI
MGSVDTNNADRDNHLRSTDFFSVDKHPTMKFSSTAIGVSDADEYTMTGELAINGISKPIEMPVEFHGSEVHPATGELHAGFSALGELKRSEFGIDFGILPIGVDKLALADVVKFELDVQFTPPSPAQ